MEAQIMLHIFHTLKENAKPKAWLYNKSRQKERKDTIRQTV